MTMRHIATIVVSSPVSEVEFTNIPQTFSNLQIMANWFSTGSGSGDFQLGCTLNGDGYPGSGAYFWHNLQGNGSSANQTQAINNWNMPIGAKGIFGANTTNTTTVPSVSVAKFFDYTNTNKNKTMISLAGNDNNGSGWVGLQTGVRMNTDAITSIKLWSTATAHSLGSGSRFDLYGLSSNSIATGA